MENLLKRGYDVSLDVVGKPKNKSILRILESNSHVKIHGFKTREELLATYRENDIFVLPSIRESFGLVYAEAMSQGLPVIYSKGQGFDQQFQDGVVGYGVNSLSSDEITCALEKIINNYEVLTKNALENYRTFNWRNNCERYTKLYGSIVSRNR